MFGRKQRVAKSDQELLFEKSFTRKNELIDMLRRMLDWSPGREKIQLALDDIRCDNSHKQGFDLYGREKEPDKFELNEHTKKHMEQLIDLSTIIQKLEKIVNSTNQEEVALLLAELMPAANLMDQIGRAIRRGVPIEHQSIQVAVNLVHTLISVALDNYYSTIIADLKMELMFAKKMRANYELERKKLLKESNEILGVK